MLKLIRNLIGKGQLSLQLLKISLHIANCRENRPRDRLLPTASSATQSGLRASKSECRSNHGKRNALAGAVALASCLRSSGSR